MRKLGVDRALVVSSDDGLDEISASAPTKVVEVNGQEIERYVLDPQQLGVQPAAGAAEALDWGGGTPQDNAQLTRTILDGGRRGAGRRPAGEDLALLNAGAAIYAAGASDTIAQGVQVAREAIAEGHAAHALERFVAASRRHAPNAPAEALR